MKRPLAYITAAWCGDPDTDMEIAARYCRMAYEAGFSPICPILYLPLFINDAIGTFLNYTTAQPCMETLETLALLSAVFGAYFCCFVRTKLSSFYDENSVNIFYDGPFRMNVPGVKFNNRNWPHMPSRPGKLQDRGQGGGSGGHHHRESGGLCRPVRAPP